MKTWKQALALVLALVMALSLVALPSFAEGEEDSAGLPNGVSIVSSGGSTEGTVGMEMSKTLQLNADGKTGTLTLEAYATGNSQVLQKEVPLDIVLVLDQSGSMAYKFNGQGLGWGDDDTDRRQYAMKNAVKNFINSVADKYDSETSDHRMAVVTFGSSASTLVNWTQVDGTGKSTLTTAIDRLPSAPNGGTQTGQGMQQAQTLLDNSKYTGSNQAQRTQVVIMFTDGVPGDSGFDISVANDAIKAAKTMKDNGVVVYTIGIFTGAEPSQLYGGSGNGAVGEYWDWSDTDSAAANRFMNFVSSNFKAAENVGLGQKVVNHFLYNSYYFEITKNYTRDSSNYYLTASDADGLNNVFSTISSTIGGSDATLTDTATMVDVISQYFQLPENYRDSLKAYTVPFTGTDASGNRQWGAKQTDYTTSIKVDSSKVSIAGFNYSDNWVGFHTENGTKTPRGSKMVLEIPIQVKDDTVGEVPTNDLNNSGILDGNGDMFAKFVSPVVKYAYFTVVPVTSSVDENGKNYGTRGQEKKVRLLDNPTYNLVNEVPEGFLYGGTFDDETCTTVHDKVKGQNPMAIAPVENETYYIWEVPDTYLRPFTFYVWQHVDGKETVTKLYPLVGVDRTNYADVGFAVCWGTSYNKDNAVDIPSGCNELSTGAQAGTAEVYQYLLATKSGVPVESWYLKNGTATKYMGDITATETIIDEGCIGGFRLDADQFASFKNEDITYRPYWITLDGVRVDSVRSRTLTFQEGSETPIYNPSQTGKYSAGYTYVNTPAAQTLSFRTCMLADDSQPVVDERLTVTVVDGSNTTQVKVAPNGSVRDQVAYQAPAGKVFAGWFADQAYTTPADLDQVTQDTTIYAKYVSDSYLDLAYSRTGLFRLRGVTLISAVDNPANYQASGFIVGDQKVDVSYASRYLIFKTPANLFGAARDAKLMLADKSLSGTGTLEVTPYWITLDGTEVHGITHSLHYNTRTIWE